MSELLLWRFLYNAPLLKIGSTFLHNEAKNFLKNTGIQHSWLKVPACMFTRLRPALKASIHHIEPDHIGPLTLCNLRQIHTGTQRRLNRDFIPACAAARIHLFPG